MFTLGGRRRIIRGTPRGIPALDGMAKEVGQQGWRWSAHTHPGGDEVLGASRGGGDVGWLRQLSEGQAKYIQRYGLGSSKKPQYQSLILNSDGRRHLWHMDYETSVPGGYLPR